MASPTSSPYTYQRNLEQEDALYRKRLRRNRFFGFLAAAAMIFASVILFFLLFSLMKDGLPRLSLEFFQNYTSRIPSNAGIRAGLMGTIWVISLTIVIAVPVGVAAAIYLEEYSTRSTWFVNFIKLNIANLAGVPSIVYGLLGLALFVRWMALDRSIIAGALTMSLLILPVVIIVSQEALRAVPKSFREGAFALGCTQWQTIRYQVLPSALPGILTGVILAVARAIGETAPLIVIGAVTFITVSPSSMNDRFTALPIQIFDWTSRPQTGFHQNAAGGIVVLLFVLVGFNALAIFVRNRQRARLGR